MMPPVQPHPPLIAAADELHPAALCTPTTMRTSDLTTIDLELGQPHIVHRLNAA